MGRSSNGWDWSVHYSSKGNVPWAIIAEENGLRTAAVVLLLDPLDSDGDGKVGNLEWLFGDAKKGQYKQMRSVLKSTGNMMDSQIAAKHVFSKNAAGGLQKVENKNPNFNFAHLLSDKDQKALAKVNSALKTVTAKSYWCSQQDRYKMREVVHASSMSSSASSQPAAANVPSDEKPLAELLKDRNAMIEAAVR